MQPFVPSARLARAAGSALLCALSLSTGVALASPNFPSVVERELPMACTPDCTICHSQSPGVGGTADKPFVLTLAGQGFDGSEATLVTALSAIKVAPFSDSDADTITDVDELMGTQSMASGQLTTNPNVPDTATMPSANVCPPAPAYGCGAAHVTPRPHFHTEHLLLGLLGGLLALGVWRRIAQRRSS